MPETYGHHCRCPVSRKVIHESQWEALRHMRRLGKTEEDGVAGLNVYQCRHCQGWHVGHSGAAVAGERKDTTNMIETIKRDREEREREKREDKQWQ